MVPRQHSSGGKQRLGKHRRWGRRTFGDCLSPARWP
ncbi:MAG: hypothetical protein H0T56_17690 [Pseudaminobacter sp.]|nr:hypothetical protein [Pseudaminobacter sp.]